MKEVFHISCISFVHLFIKIADIHNRYFQNVIFCYIYINIDLRVMKYLSEKYSFMSHYLPIIDKVIYIV